MTFRETLIDMAKFARKLIAIGIVVCAAFTITLIAPTALLSRLIISTFGVTAASVISVLAITLFFSVLSASITVYAADHWRWMGRVLDID